MAQPARTAAKASATSGRAQEERDIDNSLEKAGQRAHCARRTDIAEGCANATVHGIFQAKGAKA
jgi:hypothetical protein